MYIYRNNPQPCQQERSVLRARDSGSGAAVPPLPALKETIMFLFQQNREAAFQLVKKNNVVGLVVSPVFMFIYPQTVYNTKGSRAHTHKELREWLWEPKGSSLEYIKVLGGHLAIYTLNYLHIHTCICIYFFMQMIFISICLHLYICMYI